MLLPSLGQLQNLWRLTGAAMMRTVTNYCGMIRCNVRTACRRRPAAQDDLNLRSRREEPMWTQAICKGKTVPRHVGAPKRTLIWRRARKKCGIPSDRHYFKNFRPRTGLVNIFDGAFPNLEEFSEKKIFRVCKTLVYQHQISGYSTDVLAPHIGWRPGQLPGWPISWSGPM